MAEEVFKTIFQMDADNTKLLAAMDEVNKKYVQSTTIVEDQKKKLLELQAYEEKLLKARSSANNPTSVVKYNEKIAQTKEEIAKTTQEIDKLNKSQNVGATTAQKFGKDLNNAFDATKVAGLKAEVSGLAKSFVDSKNPIKDIKNEIKDLINYQKDLRKERDATGDSKKQSEFNKKINEAAFEIKELEKEMEALAKGAEKPVKKAESLRAQLRKVKEELAAVGDNDEEFLRLSIAAGKLEDKLSDAREAARIFASDSPMQSFGLAIRGVVGDLASLNFADAAEKSKLLVEAGKKITFASSITGIKQLGTTLANVGKALLTNPIFLIGAVVVAVIANFSKLKNVGGLIGAVFIGIGRAIDTVIRAGKDLLDFIGLIDATKKSLEELIAFNDDLIASYENYYKQKIQIADSGNKRIIELENQQSKEIRKTLLKQLADVKADLKEKGSSTQDYFDAIKKMQEIGGKISDNYTANEVRNTQLEIKGQDKLRALRLQIADERDKNKAQEFNLGIQKDAPEQIKKLSNLAINETYRVQKEEKRVAEIDLKDTNVLGDAKLLINTKFATQRLGLKRKEVADIIAAEKRINLAAIDNDRERTLSILKAESNKKLLGSEAGVEQAQFEAEAELQILIESNQKKEAEIRRSIKAQEAAKIETKTGQRELADFLIKSDEEVSAATLKRDSIIRADRAARLDEEERHLLAMFDINKINETRITELLDNSGSARLRIELDYAKKKLKELKSSNLSTIAEIQAQQNKVSELEKQSAEQTKEEKKQQTLEILDGIKQITDATFAAFNQQLAAQVAFKDKQISLQQKRIDEAKEIADKGNAELLQLEKKRLDDLNKEKEKYVRRQQSLIVIELVANSSLAIAKAAAQGGAAAPFTIAATIISLIAGLAQAKSVAQQAAFYDGGLFEGFTGHGNPREESMQGGKKPYTYHKEEFIFNHKTTARYKDIFQDVHKGNIDLKDWQHKVNTFETIKNNPMAMMVNNNGDLIVLEGKLDKVIKAIEGQQTHLNMDGNGFSAYMKNIQSRNDFIKNNLAR